MASGVENRQWDVAYAGGRTFVLPTERNDGNVSHVMSNLSHTWSESSTIKKVSFVMSLIGIVFGGVAAGTSHPGQDNECPAVCLSFGILSGATIVTSIVLCCIGCNN